MFGFIFINKPEGITSFTAANKVRKIFGVKKAGHTGTLDPMATGVLTVMLGGATRFSQYIPVHDKAYEATIRLGIQTDTLDITGTVTAENEVNVDKDAFLNVLDRFKGTIKQYPPMYSAVSKNGVRLYELARQGIEIEREAREVVIHSLELVSADAAVNEYTIRVECSAGTYIRSLADDIGKALGCGATLTKLTRTAANGIKLENTLTLGELEAAAEENRLAELITPVDAMLNCYHGISVSDKQTVRFCNGGALDLKRVKGIGAEGLYRVYSNENEFLGLGKVNIEENSLDVERILVK